MHRALVIAGVVALVGCSPPLTRTPELGDRTDTGANVTVVGSLELTPATLDFGDVAPGSSTVEEVTLQNIGAGTLTIKQALLEADYPFSLAPVDLPVPLEGDETLVVQVEFKPMNEAPFQGELRVSTDLNDEVAVVSLAGRGKVHVNTNTGTDDTGDPTTTTTTGSVTVNPTSLDFGSVDVGSTSSDDLLVRNGTTASIMLVDLFATDNAYAYATSLTPPQMIPAGEQHIITVDYSPMAEGVHNATFEVVFDNEAQSRSTPLRGQGVSTCDICAPAIHVDTGSASSSTMEFFSLYGLEDAQTVTVYNVGDEDLEITELSVNNDTLAECGTFALNGAYTPRTITPSNSTTFEISYTTTDSCLDLPQASSDLNVVHIRTNDPWEPDYVIELSGTGLWL